MENFKDTIITDIETVLNTVNTHSCTILKEEYKDRFAVGMNSQAYQYAYIYVLENTPKICVFVDIAYNGIDICLYKYDTNIFAKSKSFKLFQNDQLEEYLTKAFEEIEF